MAVAILVKRNYHRFMTVQTKTIGNVKIVYKNGTAVSGVYVPKPVKSVSNTNSK